MLNEKIEDCIFGGEWISTSRNFNNVCVFWQSINVGITEKYVPEEFFRKKLECVDPWEKIKGNNGYEKAEINHLFALIIDFSSWLLYFSFEFRSKLEIIQQFFVKKIWKRAICFTYVEKKHLREKEATYQKSFFVERTLFFAFNK